MFQDTAQITLGQADYLRRITGTPRQTIFWSLFVVLNLVLVNSLLDDRWLDSSSTVSCNRAPQMLVSPQTAQGPVTLGWTSVILN